MESVLAVASLAAPLLLITWMYPRIVAKLPPDSWRIKLCGFCWVAAMLGIFFLQANVAITVGLRKVNSNYFDYILMGEGSIGIVVLVYSYLKAQKKQR